jgi:hypothetical protein
VYPGGDESDEAEGRVIGVHVTPSASSRYEMKFEFD